MKTKPNIDNFNNIESQSNLSYPEYIENNINLDLNQAENNN